MHIVMHQIVKLKPIVMVIRMRAVVKQDPQLERALHIRYAGADTLPNI